MMEHQKLQGLMTQTERIARVASAGLLAAQAKQTAPSGAISLDNADGTRTIIGEVVNGESNPSYTMATHVGDETPPGIPTGITATSKSGVVVVEWDGTLDGGIPDDFFCVRVYLDGAELGALTEAGSVASAKLDGGTTVLVTATSEDDCCLPDGTPDHNVSAASQAISITVTSSAAEIIVDVQDEIDGIEQEITDFKGQVQANYYTKTETNASFSTKTEVGAVYRDSMARNLSPFYSHDFTDVYDAENPEGYWNDLTTALTEQISDGWAHVTLDNSAGTGNMYAYATVRAAFLPIVAGTVMVEIRNVQVATEGRWGIGRVAQGLTFPQLDVTEAGTYYRPATVNNPDPANGVAISLRFYALAGVSVEFDARISYYQGEYSGEYKQFNADTANLTRDYATKTWTEQTAEDYSIAAAQKYTATLANANLGPFYAHDLDDVRNADTNPGGYWHGKPSRATQLSDGWARIVMDNTAGASTMYAYMRPAPDANPVVEGTMLLELRNFSGDVTEESGHRLWFNPATSAAANIQVHGDAVEFFTQAGERRLPIHPTGSESPTYWGGMWWAINAGHRAEFDARVSFYASAQDGTETIPYDGPFKPYVTDQQALSKEYATQSQLTVGINGIRTEVSRDYQTKAAMGDYSTTAQMNTAINQSAESITSTVAATYETQAHANTTYSTKTEVQQTVSGLDTRISANATAISGEVTARETLIRQYANGVLVCKVGESVGALVNASGSFDVVSVTWSGNNPTVGGTVASLSDDTVSLLSDYARMYVDSESEDFVIASNNSVTLRSNGGSCDLGSYSYEEHGGQTYSEGVGMNMHDEMIEALLWDEYAGTECEFYATSGHGLFINKIAAAPVELFSGNTTGTVTLSETAANFDRLVIYYEAGGSGAGSVEVSSPNGKTFSMQGMYFASSANIVQQRFKVMSISGTSITRVSSGYINTSTSGAVSVNTTENNIAVVRVLGYRKYPR